MKPEDGDSYGWNDFAKYAEANWISLKHEDDWRDWWDCWVNGYITAMKQAGKETRHETLDNR